jgi:hypothetical protein
MSIKSSKLWAQDQPWLLTFLGCTNPVSSHTLSLPGLLICTSTLFLKAVYTMRKYELLTNLLLSKCCIGLAAFVSTYHVRCAFSTWFAVDCLYLKRSLWWFWELKHSLVDKKAFWMTISNNIINFMYVM